MTGGRPEKHSLTLRGHRTSVSLEAPFWEAFREIARARGQAVGALATEIDAARGPDVGLASAIRLYILRWYRDGSATDAAPPRTEAGNDGARIDAPLPEL